MVSHCPPVTGRLRTAMVGLLLALTVGGGCAAPGGTQPSSAGNSAGSGAAGTTAAASSPGTPPQAARARIALPSPLLPYAGVYIAIHQGYAREERLDAELLLRRGVYSAQAMAVG